MDFTAVVTPGTKVEGGDVIGTVPETPVVLHKIMVPHRMDGTVEWVAEAGAYTIRDVIAKVRLADGSLKELTMVQKWPVRVGRPYRKKFPPSAPLQTGQRVIDTMFPRGQGRHRRRARALRLRQDCGVSTSWPSGRMWTSWSTSAAASVATR